MTELKIEKRFENIHMEREEIECIVDFKEGTPKREEIIELIAKTMTTNKELVVINKMLQQFGMKQARVIACVYKSPDAMKRVLRLKDEPKKEEPKSEEKKTEAKPAEVKKEKKAEEKKEEVKTEAPKAEEKPAEKKEEPKKEEVKAEAKAEEKKE